MFETKLFKDRMCKIDKQVRLNYFICVFLKTFPISDVCLYGDPTVIRCVITIDKHEIFKNFAATDFKKIFIVDDNQLEIITTKERSAYLSSSSISEELRFQVVNLYEQMFPCSFILNMFNDDNVLLSGKKVIVLPSIKAKEATINTLESIIQSINPSSELVEKKPTLKQYIECTVGNLDEQCFSKYLPDSIKFKICEQNSVFPIMDRKLMLRRCNNLETTNEFTETNQVVSGYAVSTLSGILKYNEDYFIFTTGHGLNDTCTVDSDHYSLKDFMWPCSIQQTQIQQDLYFKSNIANNTKQDYFTVSDVAVLQPHEDVKEKFFANKQSFIEQDFIHEYNKEKNPVLPKWEQIKGNVEYSGMKTKGEMKVEGTAYIGRAYINNKGNGEILIFHERLYVASPPSLRDGECSVEGDSGACVIKKVTVGNTEEVKIHSFLKGSLLLKTKNYYYKLLSPAHFVLEQVKKLLGDDASPSFVSYTACTMTCTSDEDSMKDDFINQKDGTIDTMNDVSLNQNDDKCENNDKITTDYDD